MPRGKGSRRLIGDNMKRKGDREASEPFEEGMARPIFARVSGIFKGVLCEALEHLANGDDHIEWRDIRLCI